MKNTYEKGLGSSSGKIILMGEHAVVHGEPSIAIPFPETTVNATVESINGPVELDCYYHQGAFSEAPDMLKNLTTTIQTTLKRLNRPLKNFKLTITSTVPPERGMGSSAAVAVAIVRALYAYFKEHLSREELLDLVGVSEKIAHGNPSGLDAIMTSSTTPVYYVKGQPFEPFSLAIDAYLIVADTGVMGETKKAVGDVMTLLKTNPEQTKPAIHRLGKLAETARTALESNQPKQLGAAMTEAHQLLSSLTVSSDRLNAFVAAALNAGALGAKLTGGGRGGCMIALADQEEIALDIEAALKQVGADHTWIYHMGDDANE